MKKVKIAAVLIITALALSGCASWDRLKKSWSSELGNGLEREVVITDQTGKVVYEDSGKFDVEVNDYRVKYIDEKGKLHIIYLGASTAVVNEK